MHLVIDAYNLIHRTMGLAMAEAGQEGDGRKALCMALSRYRKKRGHRITAVFDGGRDPEGGRATLHGIPARFSGRRRSADEVIMSMVRRQGGGLTVITDDRELADACRAGGAEVIGAGEFGQRLMRVAYDGEVMDQDDQGWDFTTKKKGPSRRLPKSQRRRQRRLKRL